MRSPIISSIMAVALLATANSHALTLTDSNSNGMSDYWEKHWNNGAVFPSSFSPTADPDGDGWNNLTESVAGTNPKDPQPPTGLVQVKITESPTVEGDPTDAPKAFVISWPTIIGKQYKLMVSSDLSPGSWVLFDQPMMGTGAEIQIAVEPLNEDGTRPQRLFWRVAADDTDTDGDTLSDYEEAAKGTNPLSGDTDGDGITDNIDSTPTISNAVANPDGAGLVNAQNAPLSIANGMIGRWDFENTLPYSPPAGSSQQPFYYPDSTSNGRKAVIYNTFSTNPEGMVSKAYDNENGSFLSFPNDLIGNRTVYSVSFWAMIKQGAVSTTTAGNPVGLFSHHYRYPAWKMINGVKSYTGRYTDYVNGVWIEKKSATEELLRAGSHIYRSHDDSNNNINPPIVIDNGLKITRPLGSSDDGKWHQYTFVVNGSNVTLYIDGVPLGTNGDGVNAIDNGEFSSISLGRMNGQSPTGTYASGNGLSVTATRARFDRLRLYSRVINASEAKMLAQEDIDHDGLWDVTENATRLWRDLNSDGISTPGERQYMVSPFIAQPVEGDADDDGLTNLMEQDIGTEISNPDTDGDLMPDGWEYQYSSMAGTSSLMMAAATAPTIGYLNPLVADATGDLDGDGVNNLNEYRYAANPRSQDSDSDGKNDNIEIGQGSGPSDPSDSGNPIPPAEKVSILLGVGDQSGSHSEDYVLNCFRVDPATGQEQRFYTLRSGGHGQYAQETQSIFKKGESYTFQLKWQSSSLTSRPSSPGVSAEGPDFDYTFKIQPQGTTSATLVDSYDRNNHTLGDSILSDGASDVAPNQSAFKQNYESKRVALLSPKVEWVAVDSYNNLDNHVDPWGQTTVQGKRIYPDYKDPNSSQIRHSVKLVVKGGLEGIPVYAKAFDIDDSTSESFDEDLDGSAHIDTNGKSGDDNLPDYLNTLKTGQFWKDNSWSGAEVDDKFDSTGKKEFYFRVGMQPGNNYRSIISVKDSSGFDGVQTSNATANGYLGPQTAQNGGKLASEPLTVWRHLWIENDSMSQIPRDNEGYKMNDISQDLGSARVIRAVNLVSANETQFVVDQPQDAYNAKNLEHGRIVVQGVSHDILTIYSGSVSGVDRLFIQVTGNFSSVPVGTVFRLYDDDDYGINYEPLPRSGIVNETFKALYRKGFIEPVDVASTYTTREFFRNYPVTIGPQGATSPGIWDDSLALTDSKALWVGNLIAAYQGNVDDDKDPNDEGALEGVTNGDTRRYSIVYVETIRDTNDAYLRSLGGNGALDGEFLRNITLTAAHEIGHMPGGGTGNSHHAEGYLMGSSGYGDGLYFSSKSIRRFRGTDQWQQK